MTQSSLTRIEAKFLRKGIEPLRARYSALAEMVRKGDESVETLAALSVAETAYRASLPPSAPTAPGWYNLPIAKAMWDGDRRGLETTF